MSFKVYMAKFPDETYYIGLTKRTVHERKLEHKSRAKSEKHKKIPLYLKIREFGFEKIEWEILGEFKELEEAEIKEKESIRLRSFNCLNILSGGMGTDNKNKELRIRVSEGMVGRKQSKETKEKLRKANKKQFSTIESRQKHSERMKKWHRQRGLGK